MTSTPFQTKLYRLNPNPGSVSVISMTSAARVLQVLSGYHAEKGPGLFLLALEPASENVRRAERRIRVIHGSMEIDAGSLVRLNFLGASLNASGYVTVWEETSGNPRPILTNPSH